MNWNAFWKALGVMVCFAGVWAAMVFEPVILVYLVIGMMVVLLFGSLYHLFDDY